ncbi:MAG: NADH-ubiquinone oxidoreductase-F iron-sulfur binding region domain-containing protein [Solirubrobacteraceae bacterium]
MSLPRLLLGVAPEPMGLATHLDLHGELVTGGRSRGAQLLAELANSGLRGRGGGGFPLGAKLEAVLRARGRAPVVVVNATEGEPMSLKDRMLVTQLPHLLLDGAECVAEVVGASEIVIALDERFNDADDSLRRALRERRGLRSRGPATRMVAVPSGYVRGQETAIVSLLNGGAGLPTSQPPRITQRGVSRRPTLMSNVETLAHVALIARHGAKWFRRLGPPEEPGSVLVTLGGGVQAPGVYEIAIGSQVNSLVHAAGGLSEPSRAFLLGGYSGGWIDSAAAGGVRLSTSALRSSRTSLGAGVVVALPQSACPVAEVVRISSWMADESAGQCGPCSNGLDSIADALAEICAGAGVSGGIVDIRRWAALTTGRGACAHPDGAARFVTSALRVFAQEFEDHARHGLCDACDGPPTLLAPRRRSLVR